MYQVDNTWVHMLKIIEWMVRSLSDSAMQLDWIFGVCCFIQGSSKHLYADRLLGEFAGLDFVVQI